MHCNLVEEFKGERNIKVLRAKTLRWHGGTKRVLLLNTTFNSVLDIETVVCVFVLFPSFLCVDVRRKSKRTKKKILCTGK